MDTERTIIMENVANFPISLVDTQKRMYSLDGESRIRISKSSLQDILDYRPSKIIFDEGNIKVSNISKEDLYNMGLTEDEINLYLKEEKQPTIVVKENLEDKEEKVIEVEKPAVKKTTTSTKKAPAKKPSTKKNIAKGK